MNKKTKYFKTSNRENIDSLALFFLFYCSGPNPVELYKRHRAEFLRIWKESYPATRPIIFWKQEHPESYQRLFDAAMEKMRAAGDCIFSGIDLDAAKSELMQLEELDRAEYNAEPRPACFRELRAAYFDD